MKCGREDFMRDVTRQRPVTQSIGHRIDQFIALVGSVQQRPLSSLEPGRW
jgi:hypothetical protein